MANISATTDRSEILEEMRRLRELYKLKRTLRYDSRRDFSVHSESVAEHLYGMMVLAHYFLPLEDADGTLDHKTVFELILFHDIGEADTGDIVSHWKTAEHEEAERLAVQAIAQRVPKSISETLLIRVEEYEAGESSEAMFVRAIDKLEPIFELLDDVNITSFKRLNTTAEMNAVPKRKALARYPVMSAFLEAGMDYFLSRDAFVK